MAKELDKSATSLLVINNIAIYFLCTQIIRGIQWRADWGTAIPFRNNVRDSGDLFSFRKNRIVLQCPFSNMAEKDSGTVAWWLGLGPVGDPVSSP